MRCNVAPIAEDMARRSLLRRAMSRGPASMRQPHACVRHRSQRYNARHSNSLIVQESLLRELERRAYQEMRRFLITFREARFITLGRMAALRLVPPVSPARGFFRTISRRTAGSTIVRSVDLESDVSEKKQSNEAGDSPASRTGPIELQCAGSRVPTLRLIDMILCFDGARA